MASSMEKYHTSKNYIAILIAIILLVLAGGCVADTTSSQTIVMPIAIQSAPAVNPALPASPAVPPSVSTHDSLFECNPDPQVLMPGSFLLVHRVRDSRFFRKNYQTHLVRHS